MAKQNDKPTKEQKDLEDKQKKDNPSGGSKIGSKFEEQERKARDEADEATAEAEELQDKAAAATKRANEAATKAAQLKHDEEWKDTFVLRSKYDHTVGLNFNGTRVRLVFNLHTLLLSPPTVKHLNDTYGLKETTYSVLKNMKTLPSYKVDWIVVEGPHVKLSKAESDFNQAMLRQMDKKKLKLVHGPRATGDRSA